MIEIILVVLILSILFFSFRNIFQIQNKDVVYGQTCIEHLYGEIDNFVKSAIRSQDISSGATNIYPDQYLIYMIPSKNTIALKYIASGTTTMYRNYELTGIIPSERYCHTSEYNIIISWNDSMLTINKGLGTNAQHQSFRLSWAGQFQLTTDILLQNTNGGLYKQIGQFLIDTRTQSLQKKICLSINTGWNCDEWDK